MPISIFAACCFISPPGLLYQAGFRDLSKLTSEEQRFHRRRLYTQNSAPQTASERQKTLVPFITHPGQNCFCPSQWGFGSISNYQRHCVEPQGHGHDEKRCRCEEVPFGSINMLFIGRACLSEEHQRLHPPQKHHRHRLNHDTISVDHSTCFIAEICSRHRFPFLQLQNPVWFSSLRPISVWKCNILVCDSHSALLMELCIGGWNLAQEIWASRSNWYPTGYYGCLSIGWWSVG